MITNFVDAIWGLLLIGYAVLMALAINLQDRMRKLEDILNREDARRRASISK